MIVFDDFLEDPEVAVADAHEAGFRDVDYKDGETYPGISPGANKELRDYVKGGIQALVGFDIEVQEFFYRRSEKDVVKPHWAHTDTDVSQFVALIYLTDPPADVDAGTVILEHIDGWRGQPTSDEQLRQWKEDTNDPSKWNILSKAEMAKNRIVIHSTDDLHAATPHGGFGEGADARMVLICFFNQRKQFVRMAQPHDIPQLAELALEFAHERGPMGLGISVNVPGFMASMNNDIMNNPMYGCFVAIHGGLIVGACAVRIGNGAMDNRQLIASEQFWYVTPQHRKSRLGLLLYNKVESWAKEMGADLIDFVALAASEESVRKFYLKRGYKELETHFVKVL